MKKYLIIIVLAIAGVIIFVPEVRGWLLGLVKKGAVEMKIQQESESEYVKVYTSRSDARYYHRKSCPTFSKDEARVPRSLEEAKGAYEPCPVCKPPQ